MSVDGRENDGLVDLSYRMDVLYVGGWYEIGIVR